MKLLPITSTIKLLFFMIILFGSNGLISQNIQEAFFNAKWSFSQTIPFFANTQTQIILEGDSIINLSFNKPDSGFQHMGERWHYQIDENLQTVDSFQVWTRQSSYRPSFIEELQHRVNLIQNGMSGEWYYYELLLPSDTSMQMNLYSTLSNLQRDSLLFSENFDGYRGILPYVYDTSLFVLIEADNNNPYTARTYGLPSSTLIKEDTNSNVVNGLNTNMQLANVNKVIPSKSNPDHVYLFASRSCGCLVKVDWVNQRFLGDQLITNRSAADSLIVRHQVIYHDFYDAHVLDSNNFLFLGSLENFDSPRNNNYSFQIGFFQTDDQDSLISFQEFGNPFAPDSNDAYGLIYRKFNNKDFILGIEGAKRTRIWGPYTTKMVLYTLDANGVDSLYIHRNSNRMPVDMQMTSNGDLYISSVLNVQASNPDLYVSVTKIPAALFTAIEEQEISKNLVLYPNPSSDWIKSDEFLSAERIDIYSIKGRLVKSLNGGIDQVSVQELSSGSYILQLHSAENTSSGIFIKE